MDSMTDPLDREIARALAVDPSPEFVARVRTRIVHEPTPASMNWRWMLAAVAVAAAAVVAVVTMRPAPQIAPGAPLLASRSIALTAVILPSSPAEAGHYRSAPATTREVGLTQTPVGSAFRRTYTKRTAPDVLVDPREARAIRAFLDGLRGDAIEMAPLSEWPVAAVMEPARTHDILITPIDFGLPSGNPDKGVPR